MLIRAKLALVALMRVTGAFDDLVEAWQILIWNVSQYGPSGRHGEYEIAADGKDATRVRRDLATLKSTVPLKSPGALD